jgi:hypothetical protein
MLHDGGESWKTFNRTFQSEILKSQKEDGSFTEVGPPHPGEAESVSPPFRGESDVARHGRACLAALTLEVYYRYLPTTGR